MCTIVKWMNDNNGFVTGVFTMASTIASLTMAWFMYQANKLMGKSIEQVKTLELDKTRPYLVIDMISDRNCIFLTLNNVGQTSAYKVKLTMSPELESTNRNKINFALTNQTIGQVTPGRSLRDFIDVGHLFFKRYNPAIFAYTLEYEGKLGTIYTESGNLDLQFNRDLVDISSPDVGKEIAKIANNTQEIVKKLNSISTSIKKEQKDD